MRERSSQRKFKLSFRLWGKKKRNESSPSSAILPEPSTSTPSTIPTASSFLPVPTVPPVQPIYDGQSTANPERIDRIPLPHLLMRTSTNIAVLKVQEELQKAMEELQAEISKYANKHLDYAPLQDEDVNSALSSSNEDGTGFGQLIDQVLSDQKAKSETVAGKVAAFMHQLSPITGIVLGVVAFSADAAGLLPLKITANAVNAIVKAAATEQARSESILTSLPVLKKYNSFFANLHKLGQDKISDGLYEAATKLFVAVAIFLRVTLEFLDANRIVSAAKALKTDKLAEAKSALSSAVTDLDIAVNQEVLFDEKSRAWRKECERAMDFLSDLPVLKAHDDIRNLRVKNTGNWILQDATFLKWMNGEVTTIWCPGKPGAGKTFLCSNVIDRCRDYYHSTSDKHQAIGVAWVYCSYTSQSAQMIHKIIASLAKQLVASACLEKGQQLLKVVKKFQDDHKDGSPSLQNYLDLLSHIVGSLDRSVVIIDALDECAEIDSNGCNRGLLVKELLELGVQLLVTSRDLPIIKALFHGASRFESIYIIPDYADIEAYIHWKIYDKAYGSPKLRELIENHPSLLTDITTVVGAKYSEIFNLARLQMEQISKLKTYGRVKAALGVLPMKEGEFYDQSMRRIKANEEQADQALQILAWILRAKAPMRVQNMQYAAAIIPGMYSLDFDEFALTEEDLVDCCEGLVVILPESRTLNLAHPTIIDYLESARGQIFPTDPTAMIARCCLTYLSSDYYHFSKNNFSWYAVRNWEEYARGNCEEEVLDLIIELFKRNLRAAANSELRSMTREAAWDGSLTLHADGIWIACRRGLSGTVRKLLEMGESSAKVDNLKSNALNLKFLEPLHMAINAGFPKVVQVLLDCGVDPNTRQHDSSSYYSNHTSLHIAVSQYTGRDMVDILLKNGAVVNAKDGLGRTPLHILLNGSWRRNKSAIATLLLTGGADPNAEDNFGTTPLHTVLLGGRPDDIDGIGIDLVASLLEQGAKLEARDNKGNTPLSWATNQGAKNHNTKSCGAIRSLVKKGADVEAADNKGRTPLHIAAGCYWAAGVHVLLEEGADTNAKDKLGQTPMDLARIAQKQVINEGYIIDFPVYQECVFAEKVFNEKVMKLNETIALLENASNGLDDHCTGEMARTH